MVKGIYTLQSTGTLYSLYTVSDWKGTWQKDPTSPTAMSPASISARCTFLKFNFRFLGSKFGQKWSFLNYGPRIRPNTISKELCWVSKFFLKSRLFQLLTHFFTRSGRELSHGTHIMGQFHRQPQEILAQKFEKKKFKKSTFPTFFRDFMTHYIFSIQSLNI